MAGVDRMKRVQADLNAIVRQLGKQQTNSNWHVWRIYFRKVGDEITIAGGNIEHDVDPPEFVGFLKDDIG
jgi:hypothetical protein